MEEAKLGFCRIYLKEFYNKSHKRPSPSKSTKPFLPSNCRSLVSRRVARIPESSAAPARKYRSISNYTDPKISSETNYPNHRSPNELRRSEDIVRDHLSESSIVKRITPIRRYRLRPSIRIIDRTTNFKCQTASTTTNLDPHRIIDSGYDSGSHRSIVHRHRLKEVPVRVRARHFNLGRLPNSAQYFTLPT